MLYACPAGSEFYSFKKQENWLLLFKISKYIPSSYPNPKKNI